MRRTLEPLCYREAGSEMRGTGGEERGAGKDHHEDSELPPSSIPGTPPAITPLPTPRSPISHPAPRSSNPGFGGFDAIVGNPPWEIQKPNSKEWFSNVDPLYRAYGKQEAIAKQREYFEIDADIERDWLQHTARLKALSNWTKNAGQPFGDEVDTDEGIRFTFSRRSTENEELHALWLNVRARRSGYADVSHPFLHQGSADINNYKLFLEQAHALLRKPVGRVTPCAPPAEVGRAVA